MTTTIAVSGGTAAKSRPRGEPALRALLAAVFVVAGAMKLAATEFEVRGFAHFGYAPWFMYAIGVLELLSGLALLLLRRFATPAALLLAAVMAGAAVSHIRAGDGVALALPALVLMALLAAVGAARRRDAWQP